MNKNHVSNLLDYLSIAIISAIIALSPWPYGSVGIFAQFYIHLACILLLLIWLIKRSFFSKEINYLPVYTPLICFLGLAFISISYSIYRYVSILEFLNWFSYLIIFFIVADTINCSKRRNLLLWIIVFAGLFYCGFGILQYYRYLPSKFWYQEQSLSSRYINSGSFGAYINLSFFLCLGLLLSSKGVFRKFILGLALIVFMVTLILSNSRLSWITFVITLTGLAFLLFKNLNSVKTKGLVSALIFGIILISAGWYFWPRIWERISVAQATQFQSLFQRFDVWKGAFKIILAHPFGSGIGAFQYIYPVFRVHSDRFLVDTAHSDLLQITSEVGIFGLICSIWFLKSLLTRAFRRLKEISRQDLLFYLGIICALVSFLLQAAVDFPLRIPSNAVLFFICAGLLVTIGSPKEGKVVIFKTRFKIFLLFFMLSGALFFCLAALSQKHSLIARNDFGKMRWIEAMPENVKAIKFMPIKAEAYFDRGRIYALRSKAIFGEKRAKDEKAAESDFLKAIKHNPYYSYAYLMLAQVYADQNSQNKAIAAFNKAIKTNPTDCEMYYPYGEYCLEHGLNGEALSVYHKVLGLFINDDGTFGKRYGSIQGLFDKIYGYVGDYEQVKAAVPDKPDIQLEFKRFLKRKGIETGAK